MTATSRPPRFVICVGRGEEVGLIRVVDESGEDYLYPREMFVPIELPAATSRLIAKLSRVQHKR